jgi:putative ABC transport system permease protein
MFHQTLRSFAAHKRRFVAVAVAVVLGVSFMTGTLVLTSTLQSSFDGLFADLNRGTDAYVRSPSEIDSVRARIPLGTVDAVAAADGVKATAPIVEGYAQIVGPDGKALEPAGGTPALGLAWILDDTINPYELISGDAPAGPDEIAIDRRSARETGFVPGDTVTVLTQTGSRQYELAGIMALEGGKDTPGATLVAFPLPTAINELSAAGQIQAVAASAEPGVSETDLRASVSAALPDMQVLTGAEVTRENRDDVRESLGMLSSFLLAFAAVALFVGAFIIHNTFAIVIAQRTRDLALLRAIGASRPQIMAGVLGESVLVGVLASLAGIAAGIGVAVLLQSLFATLGLDIAGALAVGPASLVGPFLIGVAVCVVASIVPARKATTVPPIAAMRDTVVDDSGRSRARSATGLGLVVLGGLTIASGLAASGAASVGLGALAVIFGVRVLGPVVAGPVARVLGAPAALVRGITGRIARDNAARNPRRTAATASALMIGIALVGAASIVAASTKGAVNDAIDGAVTADLVVDGGQFSPGMSREVADRIATVPGVDAMSPLRFGSASIDGSVDTVVSYEPGTVNQMLDLRMTQGDLALLGGNGIAVQADTAEEKGWTIGSTVDVVFPTGERQLTVVALYADRFTSGSYILGLGTFRSGFPVDLDQQILVKAEPGTVEATRDAMEAAVSDFPTVKVMDKDEFGEKQAGQIDQFLALIYALLGLAIVIALIGIVNTLGLSIHERTRELGLLRAVGMTRRQVRTTVRWEAVIIATFGTLLGLGLGLAFGSAAVSALGGSGIRTLIVPGTELAVIALLGAAAGVGAAALPARRASRLDVLDALSTS